jgi:LysM repeat protein
LVAVLAASVVWTLWGVAGRLGSGPLAAPGPNQAAAIRISSGAPIAIAPADASVYVVQPGDTLWQIARSWQPQGEVRSLVDRLARELHGRPLQPGDRIVFPVAGTP